ncbi:MAG TPA: serine/threonine-protein kinase [Sandaracinaceae bacterium LLY-WYZ-13_1]|nr:serine/threonine-protein kinase [Sandaracinaceae bacterium LLY-WYZ-13_1]
MSASANAEGGDPLIGQVVEGRYEVRRRLSAGGMGVVYEAVQQPLGRSVALKVLEVRNAPASDASFEQRFFLEASAAARLAHPNTIVVHDYGRTDEGRFFIAMELLTGGTLSQRVRAQGPLAPAQAVHVFLQIASSLRDAHEQGLVHRDMKPGNVMFAPRGGDPLFVKVLDFGLVKMVDADHEPMNLTRSGMMMGSPRYMSPEQVQAKPVDARTDIYSFGAVLYHALTGRPPFAAGSAFEAMNAQVHSPPPALRETWPGCQAGPQLEAVVMRCLAKDPAERFASMGELMDALRACEAEAGIHASRAGSYLSASHGGLSLPPSAAPAGPSAAGCATPAPASVSAAGYATPAPAQDSSHSLAQSGMRPSGMHASGAPPASTRTVRFESPSFAPPEPAPAAPAEVPAASGGGGWKLVLAAFVVLLLAAGAGAAAWLLPVDLPGHGDEPASAEETVAAAGAEVPAAGGMDGPDDAPALADESATDDAPALADEPERSEEAAPEATAEPTTDEPEAPAPLMLRTDPPAATVRRDGQDLGDTPLPLMIPAGERWTIEVSKRGYETRTVRVLAGQPELVLHLDPSRARRPRRRRPRRRVPQPEVRPLAPQPSTPSPRRYSPDLNDPWAGSR